MKEKMLMGILAVEDPYYIEKNIVPMNDKGIFRKFLMTEEEGSFLKPEVKKERFDRMVSFLFEDEKISGRITYQKKDYSHLVSAFSVQFDAKQEPEKTEVKPETKPEVKPEPRPVFKSAVKPDIRALLRPKAQPAATIENGLDEEDLRRVCMWLSQKLHAHVQVKISLSKLISFVNGIELKSKTPKKQDFTFQKLYEHAAKAGEEPLQKYIDERFDFWFACCENEAAEYNASRII